MGLYYLGSSSSSFLATCCVVGRARACAAQMFRWQLGGARRAPRSAAAAQLLLRLDAPAPLPPLGARAPRGAAAAAAALVARRTHAAAQMGARSSRGAVAAAASPVGQHTHAAAPPSDLIQGRSEFRGVLDFPRSFCPEKTKSKINKISPA
jgi:hypothetical protein